MTGWVLKRFWTDVTVAEKNGGFAVLIDGRAIRTPLKTPLTVPTKGLADAIAEEWERQEEVVQPGRMPMTRLANTVLDRVTPEFDAVAAIVAAYGETDLLCYRADGPEPLRRLQGAAWDPLLDWAASRFGARLLSTYGVVPIRQPQAALDAFTAAVRAFSPWHLTAVHELVSLTGSLVLGLAVVEGVRGPDDAWSLSRTDEEWQFSQWGRDAEADVAAEKRLGEFMDAVHFLRCLDPRS